jgi:hypothetical protein
MSTNMTRRLTALEEIAEQCRIREYREALGGEIVRRWREHGLAIGPGELDAKVDRAMATMETAAVLLAAGSTLEGVARHLAVEHDLDPERVVALYHEIRTQRGATP